MKNKISFIPAISIIILLSFLVGTVTVLMAWQIQEIGFTVLVEKEKTKEDQNKTDNKEQICIDSEGTISTASCCQTTSDFPNLCLIGACGCSLENSHQVKICDCGEGKCFDGEKCVVAGN